MSPRDESPTFGEMCEEVLDLVTGLGILLLPLIIFAVPALILLLPLAVLALPFAILAVPYLLFRATKRIVTTRAGRPRTPTARLAPSGRTRATAP